MKSSIIYFDGQYVSADRHTLKELQPGILHVRGVFETLLVEEQQLVFWNEHMARLRRGLRVLRLTCSLSNQQLCRIANEVIQRNQKQNGVLRIAVWHNHCAIVWRSLKSTPSTYRACISSYVRNRTSYSHIKTLRYRLFYEALCEAKEQSYDEAILCNSRGEIVEGAVTNVFFVKNSVLHTPSTRCGCVNGIVRQVIINLARKQKLSVNIGNFSKRKLLAADEIFVTNSGIGVKPVMMVDQNKIGQGCPGDITRRLSKAYQRIKN